MCLAQMTITSINLILIDLLFEPTLQKKGETNKIYTDIFYFYLSKIHIISFNYPHKKRFDQTFPLNQVSSRYAILAYH